MGYKDILAKDAYIETYIKSAWDYFFDSGSYEKAMEMLLAALKIELSKLPPGNRAAQIDIDPANIGMNSVFGVFSEIIKYERDIRQIFNNKMGLYNLFPIAFNMASLQHSLKNFHYAFILSKFAEKLIYSFPEPRIKYLQADILTELFYISYSSRDYCFLYYQTRDLAKKWLGCNEIFAEEVVFMDDDDPHKRPGFLDTIKKNAKFIESLYLSECTGGQPPGESDVITEIGIFFSDQQPARFRDQYNLAYLYDKYREIFRNRQKEQGRKKDTDGSCSWDSKKMILEAHQCSKNEYIDIGEKEAKLIQVILILETIHLDELEKKLSKKWQNILIEIYHLLKPQFQYVRTKKNPDITELSLNLTFTYFEYWIRLVLLGDEFSSSELDLLDEGFQTFNVNKYYHDFQTFDGMEAINIARRLLYLLKLIDKKDQEPKIFEMIALFIRQIFKNKTSEKAVKVYESINALMNFSSELKIDYQNGQEFIIKIKELYEEAYRLINKAKADADGKNDISQFGRNDIIAKQHLLNLVIMSFIVNDLESARRYLAQLADSFVYSIKTNPFRFGRGVELFRYNMILVELFGFIRVDVLEGNYQLRRLFFNIIEMIIKANNMKFASLRSPSKRGNTFIPKYENINLDFETNLENIGKSLRKINGLYIAFFHLDVKAFVVVVDKKGNLEIFNMVDDFKEYLEFRKTLKQYNKFIDYCQNKLDKMNKEFVPGDQKELDEELAKLDENCIRLSRYLFNEKLKELLEKEKPQVICFNSYGKDFPNINYDPLFIDVPQRTRLYEKYDILYPFNADEIVYDESNPGKEKPNLNLFNAVSHEVNIDVNHYKEYYNVREIFPQKPIHSNHEEYLTAYFEKIFSFKNKGKNNFIYITHGLIENRRNEGKILIFKEKDIRLYIFLTEFIEQLYSINCETKIENAFMNVCYGARMVWQNETSFAAVLRSLFDVKRIISSSHIQFFNPAILRYFHYIAVGISPCRSFRKAIDDYLEAAKKEFHEDKKYINNFDIAIPLFHTYKLIGGTQEESR